MVIYLPQDLCTKIEKISAASNLKKEEILNEAIKFYLRNVISEKYPDLATITTDQEDHEKSDDQNSPPAIEINRTEKSALIPADELIKIQLQKYQALFNSMSQGFYFAEILYDENGEPFDYRYEEINTAFEKIAGIKSEQIIGKTYNEIVPPDPESGWIECFKRVAGTGIPEHYYFPSSVYGKYFETYAFRPVKDQFAVLVTDITEWKNTEDALQESEKELKEAQRIAHLGNWYIDKITGKTTWSEELYRIFNFDPALPLPPYKEHNIFLTPESWDKLTVTFSNILKTGQSYDLELETRPDAEKKGWISVRGELVKDASGNIIGFRGVTQDITSRKIIENELHKHQEHLEELVAFRTARLDQINLDLKAQIIVRKRIEEELTKTKILLEKTFSQSSTPMVLVSMPDGIVRIVNEAMYEFLGMTNEPSAVGKRLLEVKPTYRDFDTLGNEGFINELPLAKALRGIKTSNEVRMVIRKDGSQRWELINATPIFNNEGEIIAGYLIIIDITKQKTEENALRISEKKLRDAQKLAKLGYIDIDLNTYHLEVSKEFFQILGLNPEEYHPTIESFFEFIHPIDREYLNSKFNLESKYFADFEAEHRMIKSDGNIIFVHSTFEITRDFKGKPLRLMGTIIDITEQKKSESERLRLQNLESLGILAGGIAHDFNNLLASILGRASFALENITDKKIKTGLSAIVKAAKRATGLTQQLLTFAKGGKPDKCVIDIRQIVQDTSNFSLSGSNVSVEYNFNETLKIEADPGQFAQVIQNLVINAKQAMAFGGKISISTENYKDSTETDFIKIIIKDHGIGIPKEQINKIFDPYFTTKSGGNGLGLSVCHSIIKRHEGQIFVESELNKGTLFTIVLPATTKEITDKIEERKSISYKLNILIMDDDEDIRDLLSTILEFDGHKVTVSKDGIEAIEIYKNSKENGELFDLVFMDLTVQGGMGGKEAVKLLHEFDPEARVIVSSGYADSSIANYKNDGFIGVLKKPYTREEVNEVLINVFSSVN
jgi:PAS domain S-box-containing protein